MNPKLIRRSMMLSIWIVAGTAAILSYSGIRELGLAAGFPPILSWLLPLTIDGLVASGALVVLDAEAKKNNSKSFGWWLTGIGVATSVAANVATAANWTDTGPVVAMIAHAIPPVFLALTLEDFLHVLRSGVRTDLLAAEEAQRIADEEERLEMERLEAEEAAREKEEAAALRAQARIEKASKPKSKKPQLPAAEVVSADIQALRTQGMSFAKAAEVLSDQYGATVSLSRAKRAGNAPSSAQNEPVAA